MKNEEIPELFEGEPISLRDYFAGMALQGSLADGGSGYEIDAQRAYKHADAMLAERKKKKEKT